MCIAKLKDVSAGLSLSSVKAILSRISIVKEIEDSVLICVREFGVELTKEICGGVNLNLALYDVVYGAHLS